MKIPPNAPEPRANQIWVKKDTGYTVMLRKKMKNDYWSTKRVNGKRSHSLYRKDLMMFWKCISHTKKR